MDPKRPPENKATLRRQAEEKARHPSHGAVDPSALSMDEIRNLVHELQVHQIELEMQNEELRQTQEELLKTRAQNANLYDFAPVGYLTVGEKGFIQEANLTVASLLEIARGDLVGRPFSTFVVPEDEDTLYFHRRRMREGTEQETWELRLRKGDGTFFWAQLDCRAMVDTEGMLSIQGTEAGLHDIFTNFIFNQCANKRFWRSSSIFAPSPSAHFSIYGDRSKLWRATSMAWRSPSRSR
ncbi:MAG: PAS domain-containing protein [Gemmatimonadetes bacterium]|jgi:PAS domain S-box-containing protein|nr:PAS domain-containing protein [Gemmatimonadota bacterium]